MIYLRATKIERVWQHAGIDWNVALPGPGPSALAVWDVATVVRDVSTAIADSKFFKSIDDECDDPGKKSSLLNMLNQLRYAIRFDDYQGFLKGSNVQVKEAGKFEYRKKTHKIWELKFQNKDRVYFFSHHISADRKALILMLFHHKKDQTTPKHILGYCEKLMKPFLDPDPEISLLKEIP